MNYNKIINKAWRSMWNNKILWIFGVMATQLSLRSVYMTFVSRVGSSPLANLATFSISKYVAWAYGLDDNSGFLTFFILLLIASWIVRGYLTYIGIIGINRGIVRERKQKPILFEAVFTTSQRYFRRYFTMVILAGLGVAVILIVFAMSTGIMLNFRTVVGSGSICGGLIVAPLGFAVSAWFGQAMIIMVITNRKISDSLSEAWNFIIKKHLGNYVVMLLLSIFLAIGVVIVISIPNFVVGLGFNAREALLPMAETGVQTVGFIGKSIMLLSHLLYNFLFGVSLVFLSAIWVHMYFDLKESDIAEDLPLPIENEEVVQEIPVPFDEVPPSEE